MNLYPARDQKEERLKREAIELCGKNRGSHDYMPIEWREDAGMKRITRLMCRVCFTHVSMKTLVENYAEVTL